MEKYKARVNSIETFGSVDGPGVRFVVFLKGCPMRCKYCHNPETWSGEGERYTAHELFEKAWKYRAYWGRNMENGGVTVSGGEPLLQIDFLTEFFTILKEHGVHTAIDTSGQPFEKSSEYLKKFDELLKYTDLVILDLKLFDSDAHRVLTGFGNENIFEMAQYLSDKGVPMWIRHVLVPGVTDDESDLQNIADFAGTLKTVQKTEILPYHTLGLSKWKELGITYPLDGVPTPTKEQIDRATKIFIKK